LVVRLALATFTSAEFYYSLPPEELFEFAEEVKEANRGG